MDKNEQNTVNPEELTPVELTDLSQKNLSSEGDYSPDYELYSKKPKQNKTPIIIGVIVSIVLLIVVIFLFFTGVIKF